MRNGFPRSIARAIIVLHLLAGPGGPAMADGTEDASVLDGWMRHVDAGNSLYRHLSAQAFVHLDRREREVAKLRTAEGWKTRQAQVRRTLHDLVGAFPGRTPLQARIVATLHRDGFRVEKLLYESVPGFPVTAAVFVPDGLKGRAPAIVYCSGHSGAGFRIRSYQRMILNLVRKGFVVLAFDPVGQGERRQYFDPKRGRSVIGIPVAEHTYPGAQMLLTGDSLARYMIWDGIRAVDYLLTRPDVDGRRIGIAGRSGGGTQAAYIAAFDERIRAAAIENYITSFRRLFESIGTQDVEQNFNGGLARGFDHADLLTVRAPKPTLVIATTRDMFSIQGTRETVAEAGRAYAALGGPDRLQLVEDDAPHGSTRRNREAMYRFFMRAFSVTGNAAEDTPDLLVREELRVTRTGQVTTSLEGETLFTLNRARARGLVERLEASRRTFGERRDSVLREARRLSGYQPPNAGSIPVFTGRLRRDGYVVEKYFVAGEGDYVIPLLLLLPDRPGPHPGVIYLHPAGKAAALAGDAAAVDLVRRGHAVLAPDLIGTGETGPGVFKGDAYQTGVGRGDYNIWFAAMLSGRSLVGLRAGDVARMLRFLQRRADIDGDRIAGVAHGAMGPVLLHAAAFEPGIARIALLRTFVSYESLVMNRYYRPEFIHAAVPAALTAYDLPDLAASLAPRPLLLADVVDGKGDPVGVDRVAEAYAVARRSYAGAGADAAFDIRGASAGATGAARLAEWLQAR